MNLFGHSMKAIQTQRLNIIATRTYIHTFIKFKHTYTYISTYVYGILGNPDQGSCKQIKTFKFKLSHSLSLPLWLTACHKWNVHHKTATAIYLLLPPLIHLYCCIGCLSIYREVVINLYASTPTACNCRWWAALFALPAS